ncbi:hypothetical protein F5888DRAFT_1792142 [Russula emetica]|nr:hypothetical protein F5888DRAFT_1792142 [Russula emetica]
MSPGPFALRIQHGIVGGFVPPNPSAVHDLTLEAQDTPHILLLSQFPSNPAAHLVKELEGILRKLPKEEVPSADIYGRDIGIFWQGPDGFEWTNSAPQGCGTFEGSTVVTKEDKKAFDRAVEITDVLVKRGVAHEGT